MPSIIDPQAADPIKALLIGKSGAGKTGSLASLVTAGYKLRVLDTDKGIRLLRALLTDPRYPYSALIKAKSIDLGAALHYVPIEQNMMMVSQMQGSVTSTEVKPKDARGWMTAMNLLQNWSEGSVKYGHVSTWGPDTVLVLDSFSTLAMMAYYSIQGLNGRLGARDEGYDFQRDVGGAQSQLRRLLEFLYDSSIKCNVLVISHITWVDEGQGFSRSPDQVSRSGERPNPDGYPSAIGRALSPQMGKYFNDSFVVKTSGSGGATVREICTMPEDGVICKNSAYLKQRYPIASGMAQIFAALRGEPEPTELIAALGPKPTASAAKPVPPVLAKA